MAKRCCICFELSSKYYECRFCNDGVVCKICTESLISRNQQKKCPLCRSDEWNHNLPSLMVIIEQPFTINYTSMVTHDHNFNDNSNIRINRTNNEGKLIMCIFFNFAVILSLVYLFMDS